jgi:TnpA family transposase
LATVRHLETASVDDALDVLEVLITSKLLNRAVREGNEDKLRALPDLKSAAKRMAAAMDVLIHTPQATTTRVVSLAEVWNAIEEVVPREKLMEAVKTIAEQVPADEAAEWRARLVKRYRTVQGFIELLVEVIDDSLFILDALHARDGGPKPEMVITDTASYSDIVFGLFAICGYQFSPRIADLGDTRLWRTNTSASYGPLDQMSRHTVRLDTVRAHWADMLRVAGSLTTGAVRGYDLVRMLSREGRPTGLGDAFAHYGHIFKTLHLLQFLHDEPYRRMIGAQLNVSEGRHQLARKICFGNRGELRQRYRQGLEDQLGALGLVLNAVVWWNSLYIDAAVTQLRSEGFPATDQMCSRLSPLGFDHINFLGSYTFPHPDAYEGLRPLRDPWGRARHLGAAVNRTVRFTDGRGAPRHG